MMRAFALVFLLCLAFAWAPGPAAAEEPILGPVVPSPYAAALRQQYYERLSRHPAKALGWELLLPGAGHYYVGLRPHAAVLLALSLSGAVLWATGALSERPAMAWTGALSFAAARGYGLVSAPVSAALFNAALRRQLILRF